MATNFPTSLDALTNPTGASALTSPDHAGQHTDANDAIEAIEVQIGTTASPVLARLASPSFTGTPTLPTGTIATTQTAADSSTKVATTAFVTTADNLKANLASPTFTGTVTTPALTVTNATTSGTFAQGTDYLSPYQGFRNAIINGAMNIWQRATDTGTIGVGGGGYYGVDRWWLYNNGYTSKMTQQLVGSTLPTFLYCMRFQRTSGETSIVPSVLHTPQETINSVRLAGKQATLSFYARASSGMSNTSGVSVMVNTGTGTDQKNLGASSYTGGATPITTTPTLTTSWQRFTVTGTIASTTTEIDIQINYVPAGTAGASDYFEITGVQLEEGSVATPFEHRPYQTELALCQRYFYKNTKGMLVCRSGGFGNSYASQIFFPIEMRVAPTITMYSGADFTGTAGQATWYQSATGTAAGFSVEVANTLGYGFYRTGNATSELVIFSYKAEAEL